MKLRKEVVNGCAYYEDGSDINVGSIEEDIKILNKLVTTKFNNDYSIDNVDKDAIEHILQHYTREKQINEELIGAIKNLKEIVELAEEEINNNDVNVTAILDLKDLKSLQIVIDKLESEDK